MGQRRNRQQGMSPYACRRTCGSRPFFRFCLRLRDEAGGARPQKPGTSGDIWNICTPVGKPAVATITERRQECSSGQPVTACTDVLTPPPVPTSAAPPARTRLTHLRETTTIHNHSPTLTAGACPPPRE